MEKNVSTNVCLLSSLQSQRNISPPGGVIYIGFSNKDKDALILLETSLNENNSQFEMIELENEATVADNRIYKITL